MKKRNFQTDAMNYFLETQLAEKVAKAKTQEEIEAIYKNGRRILVTHFPKINTIPFVKQTNKKIVKHVR